MQSKTTLHRHQVLAETMESIRILTDFVTKNLSKLLLTNKAFDTVVLFLWLALLKSLFCLTKKLWCFFITFFLQFLHIAEISQKAHNIRTLKPPVPCVSQILTTFNLYSGRAGMVL